MITPALTLSVGGVLGHLGRRPSVCRVELADQFTWIVAEKRSDPPSRACRRSSRRYRQPAHLQAPHAPTAPAKRRPGASPDLVGAGHVGRARRSLDLRAGRDLTCRSTRAKVQQHHGARPPRGAAPRWPGRTLRGATRDEPCRARDPALPSASGGVVHRRVVRPAPMTLPLWIRTADDPPALGRGGSRARRLWRIDTELDSLHHYPGSSASSRSRMRRRLGTSSIPVLRDLSPPVPVARRSRHYQVAGTPPTTSGLISSVCTASR